ncbi:MAG: sulfotransferase [Wenzhouxiangellaceae bacterium]|nr:sulfotransferase [Wenzhouxiangellaceae bacterium]
MTQDHSQSAQAQTRKHLQAILVLGPGRSGTSTLTRGLGALGIDLGRHFRRPVRKNPRGNYEHVALLKLSKKIRNSVGMRADSVHIVDDAVWGKPATQRLGRRMEAAIQKHFGASPVWAFKYAGSGRLLPFWLDLFARMEIEPAFVYAYRNPLSIARSRARLNRLRGHPAHNQLEWLANVVPHIDRLKSRKLVVVDYDRLLDEPQPELLRITSHLEIEVTPEISSEIDRFAGQFVRHDWRHTRFVDADLETDGSLHPLVRRAALLLSGMARASEAVDDEQLWRNWHEIQREYRQQGPTLALIDELKAANRRARWWDLSVPLRAAWNKLPVWRVR